MLGPIACALFTGNTIVLKVSEHASWSLAYVFEKIVHESLIECGYSPDLVQFVIGYEIVHLFESYFYSDMVKLEMR